MFIGLDIEETEGFFKLVTRTQCEVVLKKTVKDFEVLSIEEQTNIG